MSVEMARGRALGAARAREEGRESEGRALLLKKDRGKGAPETGNPEFYTRTHPTFREHSHNAEVSLQHHSHEECDEMISTTNIPVYTDG